MSEMKIIINSAGEISLEQSMGGIKSIKRIEPDDLIKCITSNLMRTGITSGLLPKNCITYSQSDAGIRSVTLLFPEERADISYYKTLYSNFPLPKLVFGFSINPDGRITACSLGVTENAEMLKPDLKMFHYPFSNVSGFNLCTGNNVLPRYKSLHTLWSLPYFIIGMPNNDDHFKTYFNKHGFQMRDLLEHLKDKKPEYYYTDILVPLKTKH